MTSMNAFSDPRETPPDIHAPGMHIANSLPIETSPTQQAYAEMQTAYQHFNAALFDNQLPHCLITFNRKGVHVAGYFSPARFGRIDGGAATDEIALNPIHFKSLGTREAMQTLVHEMTHLWQHHFGKPGRGRYHNLQWADRMITIGLMPSDTGLPGGKITGDHMGDYPIDGGPFLATLAALEAVGFRLTWYDRILDILMEAHAQGLAASALSIAPGSGPSISSRSGKRVKFSCQRCSANAWGKSSLHIICGSCGLTMRR